MDIDNAIQLMTNSVQINARPVDFFIRDALVELKSLRAELQRAREQEPIAYCYPLDAENLQTTECSVEVYSIPVGCPDGESTFALYAAPVPAMPMQAVNISDEEITNILSLHSSGSLYELAKPIERAVTAKAMPIPKQEPAGAIPEWFLAKDKLPNPDETVWVCVKNKNKDGGIWLHDTCSHDGDAWTKRENTWEDIVAWAYPVDPFSTANKSPRITEQDAREIILDHYEHIDNPVYTPDWYLETHCRALLNKLNDKNHE